MGLDFKELDISAITKEINTFWSSNLFQDKHITDQLWRGYLYVMQNFYTQAYQLAKARGIQTFPADWVSHWEKFVFNDDNKVDTWNPLYPYAYKLPKEVRSVYILRESPREISMLPSNSVIDQSGKIILPNGDQRLPGDQVYNMADYADYTISCPTCGGNGIYLGNPCPTCGGSGEVSGVYSPSGIPVDTVKYLKRADDIHDYDETNVALGDFICSAEGACGNVTDAEQHYIAFREKPYEVLYSQYVVRNTELIYEMFGSAIGYYKKDSQQYLREVQALWYAFWNGSTTANMEAGLSVLAGIPVTASPGYVESIEEVPTKHVNVILIDNNFLTNPVITLPTIPTESDTPGVYDVAIEDDNLTAYSFIQGLDYTVTVEYETSFPLDGITPPSPDPVAKIVFNLSAPTSMQISVNDKLSITYVDGSGEYVITIGGVEYFLDNNFLPSVYVGQYVEAYTPLVSDIKVYDYLNYPDWWVKYFGGINILEATAQTARLHFDSNRFDLDQVNGHLDSSADGALARASLWPYFTFLVTVPQQVFFKE